MSSPVKTFLKESQVSEFNRSFLLDLSGELPRVRCEETIRLVNIEADSPVGPVKIGAIRDKRRGGAFILLRRFRLESTSLPPSCWRARLRERREGFYFWTGSGEDGAVHLSVEAFRCHYIDLVRRAALRIFAVGDLKEARSVKAKLDKLGATYDRLADIVEAGAFEEILNS